VKRARRPDAIAAGPAPIPGVTPKTDNSPPMIGVK
jgi:hypothetical protein